MQMDETINIEEYIRETNDNVVIMYGKDKFFFTQRSTILNQLNNSTLYACNEASGVIPEQNILKDRPFYNIKNIGLLLNACDMSDFWKNRNGQLFVYKETNIEIPAFVSYNVLQGDTWVSALHCQDGQSQTIGRMVLAIPSSVDKEQDLGKPEKKNEEEVFEETEVRRRLFGGKTRNKKKKYNKKTKKKNRKMK